VTFLAFSPLAAYALLGGVALLILLLHWLKPRPPRTVVASTLLWLSLLKRRARRAPRWRRALALILALGIGLSLALALTRPELPALGLAGKRTVLVMDNGPSMAARTKDGSTRWSHALARARRVLDGASGEVLVLDTMGTAPVAGFVSPSQAEETLDRLAVGHHDAVPLPLLQRDRSLEVHVITDGVGLTEFPDGAHVHSVFEAADNVAVTSLDARAFPADPTRYEAFVQVYNASPGRKQVRLRLRGGDRFAVEQTLQMAAGELVDATFDVSGFEGGILGAAVATSGDALASDDIAFARVPSHRRKRVLLVTEGNRPLEDSLLALPGVRLTTATPAGYAQAMPADAYVFDRFAPAQPPARGALLLGPPPAPWLPAGSREVTNPDIIRWDCTHTLTSGVNWLELRIKRGHLLDVGAADALVDVEQGTLIAAQPGSSPWIVLGFALQESNLPLQANFPVFLAHALDWLTEPPTPLLRPTGMITVPLPNARVTDGSANAVAAVATPVGVLFEASRPDVYTIQADGTRLEVIANVLDPRRAEINRSALRDTDPATIGVPSAWHGEPWALLLLFGALLSIVEWAAYTRRLTA